MKRNKATRRKTSPEEAVQGIPATTTKRLPRIPVGVGEDEDA